MKRLSKILMLVLVVALTLGCVFAIASSAEDGATGVTTSTVDFTGMNEWIAWKQNVPNIGVHHVVSAGGNSYYEWTNYTAPGTVNDAQYRYYPNWLYDNGEYGIIEFDVATMTTLPENWVFNIEYNSRDPLTNTNTNAQAGTVEVVKVVAGQLTSGGKVIPANTESDWTHITIVFDGVKNTATHEYTGADGLPAVAEYSDYTDTVMNVYADGKLINSSKPFAAANIGNIKRAYIGWVYKGTTPVAAGTSIAIDNWTETQFSGYLGTDEADLSQLFGENAITDLANYKGTEVLFNANGYTYPAAMGNVYVATATGNVTYKTVQDAINAIATRKVEGAIHLVNAEGVVAEDGSFTGLASANVTAPVTIYTHGLAMAKPTIAAALFEAVGEDDMGETVYTYTKDENSVTFEYYATMEDYEAVIPMASFDVKAGETPNAPVIGDVYDKESGKVTLFKGWHYYDVDGNDLGTEMPAFTEENYGTIYCAVAETETSDVLFYTVLGETVNYYANASDFTNANLTGRTVVLAGNITLTETIANAKIDLNGYTLDGGKLNMFNGGFVYSSAEGGQILSQGNIHSTDAGDKLYLGYISESAKSEHRITMVVNSIAPTRNDQTFMYGIDVFTTFELVPSTHKNNGALFSNQQARTKVIRIDNCNFYCGTYTHIFSAHGTSTYDAIVTNTNFYGKGSLVTQHMYSCSGLIVNLENVHTYGEFAMTGNSSLKFNIGAGCSFANYNTQNVNSIASGYWVVASDAKVTLADQTYVKTIGGETLTFAGGEFAVGNVVEKAPVKATFNFYDVAISEVVTATPIFSQSKYLGETPTAPLVPAKQEGGKFYNVAGWIVYDAEGKEIGAIGAVTEEMNNQTYSVCPVWEEVTPAFAIVEGEVETLYPAESFISSIVTGKKLKLYADVTVTEQITFVNVDLNGYTINFTADVAFQQGNSFIYNTNTETEGHANFANGIYSLGQESATRKIYFGYSADGVKEEGKIVLTAGYFFGGKNNNYAYLYNVDYINLKAHDINSDSDVIFYQQLRGMAIEIDNCNFYCVEPLNMVGGNQTGVNGLAIKISNTNFYGAGTIFGAVSNPRAATYTSAFTNVKMYGGFRVFGNGSSMSLATNGMSVSLDENCIVNATMDKEILPEGMVLVPSTEKVTLDKTFVGADGTVYEMKGEYAAGLKVGTAEEKDAFIKAIMSSIYRNVSLDVNINYNVYIPTTYSVAYANKETVTIGGVEYWVVTFAKAPKDAIGDNIVTLNVNGLAIEYNASVVNYVKALMNVESESEYAVASKNVAKYVLNYIKTVAVAANAEADVTAIDAILGDFTIGEITVEGAIENVAPIAGVEGVALELDSKVGMVVKVQAGYVGTITVSIAGAETVNKEYTAEAPAGEEEYIVIGDIEIFNFTNDVVITNGTETMTYNLATYVNNKKTDVAYATYAYAVQAKAYHVTYGAPNTID